MKHWEYVAKDPGETDRLAASFARHAVDGTVIGLVGALGAGKTHFVRGLAAARGVPVDQVVSPTFVLCQQYDATPTIFHFDAFRLENPGDFAALGTDEIIGRIGVSLIEWSDRVEAVLPGDRLDVHFEDSGEFVRTLTMRALGPKSEKLLDNVASDWEGSG